MKLFDNWSGALPPVGISLLLLCILGGLGGFASTSEASRGYRQLPGVIEVHTDFDAGGNYTLAELVNRAQALGLEVLIPTDHDLQAMEYGIPPFRNLLRKRVERRSIIQAGADRYLAAIERVNQAQENVLVIPGAQSSPFYYWTGRPFSDTLTAHHYRKELLVIGLEKASAYEKLPLLHNGFSSRWIGPLLPRFFILLAAAGVGFTLAWRHPPLRRLALAIGMISLLMAADVHPFKSSRFDPYHGDEGIGPYQDLIDYGREHGARIFWSHPESTFSVEGRRMGPVVLKTPTYLEDLARSTGYAGFTALYGDATTAEKPGKTWDRLLKEYCAGRRAHPVWAIAGADYHRDLNWLRLDTFQTVFCVKEKSKAAVMEAITHGRMYALFKNAKTPRLALTRFRITDPRTGRQAVMGETLGKTRRPQIAVRLEMADGGSHTVTVELVRGGAVIHRQQGETPMEIELTDDAPPEKSYYRVIVQSGTAGRLLSNPIFIEGGE